MSHPTIKVKNNILNVLIKSCGAGESTHPKDSIIINKYIRFAPYLFKTNENSKDCKKMQ